MLYLTMKTKSEVKMGGVGIAINEIKEQLKHLKGEQLRNYLEVIERLVRDKLAICSNERKIKRLRELKKFVEDIIRPLKSEAQDETN